MKKRKRRKEHTSVASGEYYSCFDEEQSDEDVVLFPISSQRKRNSFYWVFVGVVIITSVNLLIFFIFWELSKNYSLEIEETRKRLSFCNRKLRNFEESIRPKEFVQSDHNDSYFLSNIIDQIYEIASSKSPEFQTRIPNNPSSTVYLRDIHDLLYRNNYHMKMLPREFKIAIADILWTRQKMDVSNIPLHRNDQWMGYFQIFSPTVSCDTLYRVGSTGDGGKYVCNLHRLHGYDHLVMYSFGVHEDISFDLDMIQIFGDHLEVHLFDPTITSTEKSTLFEHTTHKTNANAKKTSTEESVVLEQQQLQESEQIHFHPIGIGPVTYESLFKNAKALELIVSKFLLLGKDIRTLDEITNNYLLHEKVDILKLDVEYAEVPIFEYIFKNQLLEHLEVKIILVEYHAPFSISQELEMIQENLLKTKKMRYDDPPSSKDLFKMRKNHLFPFLNKLYEQGYYMFSSEQNSRFLRAMEYGFVHRSLIS